MAVCYLLVRLVSQYTVCCRLGPDILSTFRGLPSACIRLLPGG